MSGASAAALSCSVPSCCCYACPSRGCPGAPPRSSKKRPSRPKSANCRDTLEALTTMPDGPRYDDDFYAWTQYQAEVLRSLKTRDNRFDREHVAEEIEDLGKSERDTVRSGVRRILEH